MRAPQRLGDLGVMDPSPCPCGRCLPVLQSFEGRVSELIRLADGRAFPARTIEAMFRDQLQGALASQIVQPAVGVVHWRLVPSAAADRDALSHGLLARSRELFGPDADLAIDFVAAIPRTAEGKLLRVVTSAGRSSPAPSGTTRA
jgi:phenylacetate-CoA ligase